MGSLSSRHSQTRHSTAAGPKVFCSAFLVCGWACGGGGGGGGGGDGGGGAGATRALFDIWFSRILVNSSTNENGCSPLSGASLLRTLA